MWSVPVLGVRATIAVVLLAAGASKLADLDGFGRTLSALGAPRGRRALAAAATVGTVEIVLGLGSITGLWPRGLDVAILALLALFGAVTILAARRAPEVPCRCFGALTDSRFDARAIARSAMLITGALIVVAAPSAAPDLHGATLQVGLAAVAGILFAGACAHATQLLDAAPWRGARR